MKINSLRIIPYDVMTGLQNMAIDHYFAKKESKELSAVFRFYGWAPCCISIGYHQDISIVKRDYASSRNIDIVRRPTGGSAVYHCNELTYSVIISKTILDHRKIYSLVHKIIAEALNRLGFDVYLENSQIVKRTDICYNRAAESEIKYNGKKLVGSAQRIYPVNILQHGSILFSNEQTKLLHYLKYDEEEIGEYKNQLKNKSIALNDIIESVPQKSALIDKIIENIENYFNGFIYFQYLTDAEKAAVGNLETLFFVK